MTYTTHNCRIENIQVIILLKCTSLLSMCLNLRYLFTVNCAMVRMTGSDWRLGELHYCEE